MPPMVPSPTPAQAVATPVGNAIWLAVAAIIVLVTAGRVLYLWRSSRAEKRREQQTAAAEAAAALDPGPVTPPTPENA